MPGTDTHEACAGRVALVTGAARGIGQAIAFGLAKREAAVIIGGIEDLTETGELIARTGKAAVAAAPDISDPSSVAEVRKGVADEPGLSIFSSATPPSSNPPPGGRDPQPGIDRLPCQQDGRHRIHQSPCRNSGR